jgi:DNA-binding transcriptional LysR family regulator
MDIQDLRIFARVAAVQNLSAVGAELCLTPGTISKRIQALEDELSVRLFDRTTRSIRITDEGLSFFAHVQTILAELDLACASVGDKVARPKGRLKISAPATLARLFIAPAMSTFMRRYGEIDIHVNLTDRIVNLQDEGYDVAIRTGVLSDSTLIAKRLADDRQVVVAAPAYLAANGMPEAPSDLARHVCLVLGDTSAWSFQSRGESESVRVSGRMRSNSGELLHFAALAGDGVLRTSELLVAEDIASGRLVRLLAGYEVTANSAIWAVYPSAKHVLPKLRVLLDFLADWFREGHGGAALPLMTLGNGNGHGSGRSGLRASSRA